MGELRAASAILVYFILLNTSILPLMASSYGFVQQSQPAAKNFVTVTPTPVPLAISPILSIPQVQAVATPTPAPQPVAPQLNTQIPIHNGRITPSRMTGRLTAAGLSTGCPTGSDCIVSTDSTASGSLVFRTFTLVPGATLTVQGAVTINAVNVTISGAIVSTGSSGSDGSNGKVFGGDGSGGSNGGSGGSITINADGTLQVSGSISANGGNGGKGGDNECLGECHGNTGGSGGNGGSLDVRAAQFTLSGYINVNGGNGGPGGFGDGCDGHGGYGGTGGSAGSVTIRYIANTITGAIYRSGGSGGNGGGHDTDWYCRIDGYSGGDGPAGGNGPTGSMNLIQRTLSTIIVSPSNASIISGSSTGFNATGYDSEGIIYPVSPSWSVTDSAKGTVNPTSGAATVFTGSSSGTTTITATQGSANGLSTITVTPSTPASITLSTSSSTATVGQGVLVTALVKDAAGNNVADGTTVTFSTTAGSIITPIATSSGTAATTFYSTVPGTAFVNATASPAFNSTTVTYSVGPVNETISTVSLSPATVPADGVTESVVTVTLKDSFGNPVGGKTVAINSSRGATDTIAILTGTTGSDGVANFSIKSATSGSSTITAQDVTDALTFTQTQAITFTDVTPPTLVFVSPSPNNEATGVNWVFINVTSSEPLASALLEWDGIKEPMNGNGTNFYLNKTSLANANYTFTVYGADAANNTGSTESRWVSVNVDAAAPQWSNNKTTPSPATYSPSQSYQFNVTWNDDTGVTQVFFEWNGSTNYSMTGTSSEYYYSLSSLAAGNYSWRSFARDASGNWNSTPYLPFVISKAASTCSLALTPLSPVAYGTLVNVSCSCTNPEASNLLLRNGFDVTPENNQLVTLAGGNHSYQCSVPTTQNYTSASSNASYSILPASTSANLYFNGTQANLTVVSGVNSTVNVTATLNVSQPLVLYRNGSIIGNGTSLVQVISDWGVGYWNFTAFFAGSMNYTSSILSLFLRVLAAPDTTPPVSTSPPDAQYEVYSAASISWTLADNADVGNYRIMRNGTSVIDWTAWTNNTAINVPVNTSTLGAWNYTVQYNDSSNNFGNQDTVIITIRDTAPPAYSSVGSNGTIGAGRQVAVSSYWSDNYALSAYIFSTNNSGAWTNQSFTFTGTVNWSNASFTLNPAQGTLVGWRFYANDSTGNYNATPVQAILTTDATPPSITITPQWTYLNGSMGERGYINYSTNEPANATIWFGNATGQYTRTVSNSSFLVTQNTTLTDLDANATYYYVITSCDASANCANSSEYGFTTPPAFVIAMNFPGILGIGVMKAFNNSLYFAASGGRIMKSPDGVTYSNILNVTDPVVSAFGVIGDLLVAGTRPFYGQIYVRSTDSSWFNFQNLTEQWVTWFNVFNTPLWGDVLYAGTRNVNASKPNASIYWNGPLNFTPVLYAGNESFSAANYNFNGTTSSMHMGFVYGLGCTINGYEFAGLECDTPDTWPLSTEWQSLLANSTSLFAGVDETFGNSQIWKKTIGENWTNVFNGTQAGSFALGAYDNKIFAASAYGIGGTFITVYKSLDGLSWTPIFNTTTANATGGFEVFNNRLYLSAGGFPGVNNGKIFVST